MNVEEFERPGSEGMDGRLRALLRGALPAEEARALQDRLETDPALARRFDRLAEEAGEPVDLSVGVERRAVPAARMLRLREEARHREIAVTARDIAGYLGLPRSRRLGLAVVGGTAAERAAVLEQVGEQAWAAGRRVRRLHAGCDPFIFPPAAGAPCLVLEAGLVAPALKDLLVAGSHDVVVSAGEDRWIATREEPLLALTWPLGLAERLAEPVSGAPPVALLPAWVAGALGVPVPVRLLARTSGQPAARLREALEATGLFATWDLDSQFLVPTDEPALIRAVARAVPAADRQRILEALVAEATPAEAGTVVVLLARLATGEGGLAARLLRRVGTRLVEGPRTEPPVILGWARLLRQLAEPRLALRVLALGLAASPGDAHLEAERALAVADLGDLAGARRILDALSRRDPGGVVVAHAWAAREVRAGSAERAREILEEALGHAPENPYLLAALGDVLARLRAADRSARCFEAARVPRAGGVLSRWSRALTSQGRLDEAAAVLERALAMEPWNAAHWLDLADVRRQQAQLDAAEAAALRATESQAARPEADRIQAEIEAVRQHWEPAVAAGRRALEGGLTAPGHLVLAHIEEARGRLDAAVSHLLEAWRVDPAAPGVQQAWRTLLVRLGRAISVPLERAWPLPVPEPVPGLAAEEAGQPRGTWIAYGDASTSVALTATADGLLVANVEAAGRPVEAAEVAVLERGVDGEERERAAGLTDEHGELVLGHVDALESLLRAPGLGRWRVRLTLPPSTGSGA